LVRTERIGRRVRQVTLLNLGRHFSVLPKDWSSLCPRIEQILSGQAALLPLEPALEKLAQHYGAQLLLRQGQDVKASRRQAAVTVGQSFIEVDVDLRIPAKLNSNSDDVDRVGKRGAWWSEFIVGVQDRVGENEENSSS
jgi:hypothetical protein